MYMNFTCFEVTLLAFFQLALKFIDRAVLISEDWSQPAREGSNWSLDSRQRVVVIHVDDSSNEDVDDEVRDEADCCILPCAE